MFQSEQAVEAIPTSLCHSERSEEPRVFNPQRAVEAIPTEEVSYGTLQVSHYSGTLKSRHFPWNCPRNIPVQKESWKDLSKENLFPRNSPWNLPRSRKNLRATLDIEAFSLESSPKSKRPSCCAHPDVR